MKSVLITGGSRGIGAGCVKAFTESGYKVFFTYKNSEDRARALSSQTGAVSIKADAASFCDMEKVKAVTGNVDIIVNNAGISQIKMLCDVTEQEWDEMFDVNIKSMFITVKAYIDGMVHNKYGRIINISSMWGEEGGSCEVVYSAAKAAVIGFTKALAKELGPSGITVNCVSPGVIATEMNGHLSYEDMEELKEETPVCRLGKTEDIANAVLYLADEKSSFVTGVVLPVNGGIIM